MHPSQLRERNRTPALSVKREHAPLTSAKPDLGTSGYNNSQQAGCSPSTRPCRPGPAAVDALQREVRRTQDPAVQRQSIRIHQLHVPTTRLAERPPESRRNIANCIRFPSNGFTHFLTLFSKFFSSFPHGTCSLSVSCQYLALDGVYHQFWAAFPSNPTHGKRIMNSLPCHKRDCHPL